MAMAVHRPAAMAATAAMAIAETRFSFPMAMAVAMAARKCDGAWFLVVQQRPHESAMLNVFAPCNALLRRLGLPPSLALSVPIRRCSSSAIDTRSRLAAVGSSAGAQNRIEMAYAVLVCEWGGIHADPKSAMLWRCKRTIRGYVLVFALLLLFSWRCLTSGSSYQPIASIRDLMLAMLVTA